MTSTNSTGSKQFDALGLKKIINGRSWVTILGGSRMPEEVQDAMTDAANTFIDFHELNKLASSLLGRRLVCWFKRLHVWLVPTPIASCNYQTRTE